MCKRLALWLSAMIASLSLSAAPAGAAPATSVFDLYLGGLWVGEIGLTHETGALGYRAEAELRTAGIVRRLYSFKMQAETEGRVLGGRLVPERFAADTADTANEQTVEIRFTGRRPVAITAEPPFKPKPWQVDPLAQRGTADPVSAFLEIMALGTATAPCSKAYDFFDGRRRRMIVLGPERVDRSKGLRQCPAVYRRVAGFKPKNMKKPDFPFIVWYAARDGGGVDFLKAMGETPYGTAVLRRRQEG